MNKIEKTLCGLECHITRGCYWECPYHRCDPAKCVTKLMLDAKSVIEAQREAIATIKQKLTERNNGEMTPDEFAEKMTKIIKDTGGYEEAFHGEADDLMCELLVSLGYSEGVEIFKKQPKWYC